MQHSGVSVNSNHDIVTYFCCSEEIPLFTADEWITGDSVPEHREDSKAIGCAEPMSVLQY